MKFTSKSLNKLINTLQRFNKENSSKNKSQESIIQTRDYQRNYTHDTHSNIIIKFKRHLNHCTSASSACTNDGVHNNVPLKSSEQSNEDNKQRYSETKRGKIKAHLFPGRIVRNGRGQRQKRNVPRAQTMGTHSLLLL